MKTTRFVDVEWLSTHLADPSTVVIELTDDPAHDGGPGTIPGASTVYWKSLLWHRDRRELASADTLADRLHALGAHSSSTVVFAGDPPQFAAYALWVSAAQGVGGTLKYLDGGVGAWRVAEPATTGGSTPGNTAGARLPIVAPRYREVVVGREDVLAAIDSGTPIVDLRSPEEYAGHRVSPVGEPIDHGAQRHGRIPGARSLHIRTLLDEDERVLPVPELRERIENLDLADAGELIFYCRLSHRASLGWLVFEDLLGDSRVRVYDGSWTEWGSIVGAPVER
ncbi:sulfurtransferase [Rhodococcus sp. NPDC057529]|uniref:sulfurtransferase n=1 Tax=Rhodococcus sp. NPDC057529 TaxID=3346158 RepID=UPI00366C403E